MNVFATQSSKILSKVAKCDSWSYYEKTRSESFQIVVN